MNSPTTEALRDRISGTVITRADAEYDEARKVYNAMIDRRPLVVVRASGTDDVRATVNFARDNGLDLAVRGGAHSVPGFGTCDGGVVLDLSSLRAVDVDPKQRRARAQGGATWGDFNDATHEHGLATPGGIISTTGVGGLTLGGGIGYLNRAYGLSCDNLVSAQVVTADGELVTASEQEHPDLFWALRGGGGNFGVVVSFEFALHPVKEIYGGPMFFELDVAEDLLRFFREFIVDAPEQLGGFPGFQIAPPLPFIPEERHGDPLALFVACWAGPVEDGESVLKPLRDLAPTVAELVGPMPYPALNSAFDALLPPGLQHYWKANFVKELSGDAIAAHVENGPKVPALQSTMHIYPVNGACHRVPAQDTAFAYRDANFATNIVGVWPDPADDERGKKWVRDYYADVAPYSEEGGYVNFMAADDEDRVRANYGGNYDRLVSVKRAYDPHNLFHLNQNIVP
ncbi:FAD-binding oxidoreductase [Amycolatopsis acidicola]|uniref:FAD-binding oxidoreductase n=1 Tax=Amycolatopsis acidicola TaxID=2596893 RepID=A0A5N0UPL5_9PSEU|nr:FAD-binding oxidoreductase [Amycolatopsis acidicola]KAA9152989.1 FAD-binding oxidoreductase [Amycolatopsis acidicola]